MDARRQARSTGVLEAWQASNISYWSFASACSRQAL